MTRSATINPKLIDQLLVETPAEDLLGENVPIKQFAFLALTAAPVLIPTMHLLAPESGTFLIPGVHLTGGIADGPGALTGGIANGLGPQRLPFSATPPRLERPHPVQRNWPSTTDPSRI